MSMMLMSLLRDLLLNIVSGLVGAGVMYALLQGGKRHYRVKTPDNQVEV